MASNIIKNHDFSSRELLPWWHASSGHGYVMASSNVSASASASSATPTTPSSNGNYAVVTRRTEKWQGLEQNITSRVSKDHQYRVSAWVRISHGGGSLGAEVKATLRLETHKSKIDYKCVGRAVALRNKWVNLVGSFKLDTKPDAVVFYLEGPEAGVDLLVDSVVVSPFSPSSIAATHGQVRRLVKVSRTITIGSLDVSNLVNTIDKEKYSEMEDVATNLQKVFFTGKSYVNGQVLDYDTKDGSNIHMNLHVGFTHHICVKVSWSGKLIPLFVCDSDTIGDLKTKLQETEGTPANQVTLIYNGKQLEDFDTLAVHRVLHQAIFYAVLHGEEKIQIFIRMPGKETSIKLEVKQCSSVENIKTMFHCMVGFPIDQQKLTFNGVLLENDRKLSDYKIKMESVLDMDFLAPGLMKIFVKYTTGRTWAIFVNSSDTMDDVKNKIQYATGVNRVEQRLFFGGRCLEDSDTVGDYNIQEESTIGMMLRLCGC